VKDAIQGFMCYFIAVEFGTIEAALTSKAIFKVFRALFPINFKGTEPDESDELNLLSTEPTSTVPVDDMFPRTYLLLSLQQMIVEGFPLPFQYDMAKK
jgi:hypothetical protein